MKWRPALCGRKPGSPGETRHDHHDHHDHRPDNHDHDDHPHDMNYNDRKTFPQRGEVWKKTSCSSD